MDMKDFLSIVSGEKKTLNEGVEECGGAMPTAPMPEPDPVTMSVNLNARGVDNIKQLLSLMSKAENDHMEPDGDELPVAVSVKSHSELDGDEGPMNPIGIDGNKSMAMVRDLIAKNDKPKLIANAPEEAYADVDAITTDAGDGPNAPKHPKDIRIKDPSPFEEYDNEPDEEYGDIDLMIKNLSGGLNREKKAFKAAQRGDNAMAVQEMLRKELASDYRLFKESKAKK